MSLELAIAIFVAGYLAGWVAAFRLITGGPPKRRTDCKD